MFYLAGQIEKGLGVPADMKQAVWWYIQAARAGSVEARIMLSETLKSEITIEKDEDVYAGKSTLKKSVMKVSPFCVEITAYSDDVRGGSYGSGCIISPDYIVTNHHVVANKRGRSPHKNIYIDIHDPESGGKKRIPVIVAASDAREDIAVCKLDGKLKIEADRFPKFRDTHTMQCGDEVFTIGNMLGVGLGLSTGVIAKAVEYDVYGKSEVIRTSMSINGGNSGGAVFDIDGDIIGLITFTPPSEDGRSRAHGMSYAITSNTITKFFK